MGMPHAGGSAGVGRLGAWAGSLLPQGVRWERCPRGLSSGAGRVPRGAHAGTCCGRGSRSQGWLWGASRWALPA
eukprot:12361065-Alexandrium_andersonii.AAC.1